MDISRPNSPGESVLEVPIDSTHLSNMGNNRAPFRTPSSFYPSDHSSSEEMSVTECALYTREGQCSPTGLGKSKGSSSSGTELANRGRTANSNRRPDGLITISSTRKRGLGYQCTGSKAVAQGIIMYYLTKHNYPN